MDVGDDAFGGLREPGASNIEILRLRHHRGRSDGPFLRGETRTRTHVHAHL